MFRTSLWQKLADKAATHVLAVIPDIDQLLAEEQPEQVLHGIDVFTTQCRHVRHSDV